TQDPQFPVRQAALEVLGGYKSNEVKELLRKVAGEEKGGKPGRRAGALEALGRIGDAAATPIAVKCLEASDFDLKPAAAAARGKGGEGGAAGGGRAARGFPGARRPAAADRGARRARGDQEAGGLRGRGAAAARLEGVAGPVLRDPVPREAAREGGGRAAHR